MSKIVWLSLLSLLCSIPAYANEENNVSRIEVFKGGLDEEQIDHCSTEIISYCGSSESFKGYLDCAEKHMKSMIFCKQNLALLNEKAGVFKTLKPYGPVALVNADVLGADHSEDYYMVGKSGELVALTSSLDMKHLDNYANVVKKFPNMSLSPSSYALPKVEVNKDSSVRFIFQQLLLNGCHACEQIGLVRVAYDFTAEGGFKGAKAIELIVSLPGHTIAG